jgi:uncharacterized protein
MSFNWRKWNRAVHRDFGYLFLGMTLIYALSGIAINHMKDWNPNYVVTTEDIQVDIPAVKPDKQTVKRMLEPFEEDGNYRNHYFPNEDYLRIFIKDGTVSIDLTTGEGLIEKTRPRPLFREMNYLHYNPIKYWTYFSDLFSGALILLGISGILIPRGDKGITRRGLWLTLLGILIPAVYLFIYFY